LIYGIQLADRLPTGKFKQFGSLQEMAAAMVPDVLTHRREGPICLIGYSFAAVLAVELAQRLIRQGRPVPLVAIINIAPPATSFALPFRIKHFIKHVGPWALRLATRGATDPDHRGNYRDALVHKLSGHHHFDGADWYRSLPKDHQDYVTSNDANLRRYRFGGVYGGKIILIRQMPAPNLDVHPLRFSQLEDYGWGATTGANVEVVHSPADHGSMMEQPNVEHIANALHRALSECDRGIQLAKPKSSE
jgi:thioesterase domain-containing protein